MLSRGDDGADGLPGPPGLDGVDAPSPITAPIPEVAHKFEDTVDSLKARTSFNLEILKFERVDCICLFVGVLSGLSTRNSGKFYLRFI